MTFKPSMRSLSRLVAGGVLLASASAFALGFTITQAQESLVKVGMTRAEVQAAIGRPSTNAKYRNQSGRTWTYEVVGNTIAENTVFEVDFGSDDRVVRAAERVQPPMK